MKMLHISHAMAEAVIPHVTAMVKAGVLKRTGRELPFDTCTVEQWAAAEKSLDPATRDWVDTLSEMGFRLNFQDTRLFRRGA